MRATWGGMESVVWHVTKCYGWHFLQLFFFVEKRRKTGEWRYGSEGSGWTQGKWRWECSPCRARLRCVNVSGARGAWNAHHLHQWQADGLSVTQWWICVSCTVSTLSSCQPLQHTVSSLCPVLFVVEAVRVFSPSNPIRHTLPCSSSVSQTISRVKSLELSRLRIHLFGSCEIFFFFYHFLCYHFAYIPVTRPLVSVVTRPTND